MNLDSPSVSIGTQHNRCIINDILRQADQCRALKSVDDVAQKFVSIFLSTPPHVSCYYCHKEHMPFPHHTGHDWWLSKVYRPTKHIMRHQRRGYWSWLIIRVLALLEISLVLTGSFQYFTWQWYWRKWRTGDWRCQLHSTSDKMWRCHGNICVG